MKQRLRHRATTTAAWAEEEALPIGRVDLVGGDSLPSGGVSRSGDTGDVAAVAAAVAEWIVDEVTATARWRSK